MVKSTMTQRLTIGRNADDDASAIDVATRKASESQRRAAANRARFPVNAAVLDQFRAVFGPGCRWVYLYDEQGAIGKPGPPGVPLSDWLPPELRKPRGKR